MADLNDGQVDLHRSGVRFVAFGLAAVVLLTALGGRLFQLQVVQGEELARRAVADRTVEVPVAAPRGLIFDRDGRPLAVNTPSWTVKVRPADLPEARRAADPGARGPNHRRRRRPAPLAARCLLRLTL